VEAQDRALGAFALQPMSASGRGLPDPAHANTWIMLEPGWFVRDVKGGKAIEVSYEHTRIH
jgi:hypothetical protein